MVVWGFFGLLRWGGGEWVKVCLIISWRNLGWIDEILKL